MGIYLKSLTLENYCGYRYAHFDFFKDNAIKNLALFYGPNGIGKSSLLYAIDAISYPWQYMGRNSETLLRKSTFHKDYNPSYAGYYSHKGMKVTGIFLDGEIERKVVLENTDDFVGVSTCELEKPDGGRISPVMHIDADNPMNLINFQIKTTYLNMFLDIANAIYDYKCEVPRGDLHEVEEKDKATGEYIIFCTDFILHKPNGTKVHFKRMSAGERKIATLLSTLCNPLYLDAHDIFTVDNFSMHTYWKRHKIMVDKFLQHFHNKQLIITDHSGVLIQYVINKYPEYAYDLETYVNDPVTSRRKELIQPAFGSPAIRPDVPIH